MSRQLNLRVSDHFVERLDRVARHLGQPMATVLEKVGTPALELAEADALFEDEALAAWEDYQLTGKHVTSAAIDAIFAECLQKAQAVVPEDCQ
jgi:predicted transcriptional regulator